MTRVAAWCAFVGWIVIPVAAIVVPVASSHLEGCAPSLRSIAASTAGAALVLLAGSAAGMRGWRRGHRTRGAIAAGALCIAGFIATAIAVPCGFRHVVEYETGEYGAAVATSLVDGRVRFDPGSPPTLNDGLVPAQLRWKWYGRTFACKAGYADAAGTIAIPLRFQHVFPFEEGLGEVYLAGYTGCGFVDSRGAWVIPPIYESLGVFSEGKIAAKWKGRWGYLDRKNRWVIEPRFDDAAYWWEGLGRVRLGKKWGFIGAEREMAIEPRFARAGVFHEGRAEVRLLDGSDAVIDRRSEVVARE